MSLTHHQHITAQADPEMTYTVSSGTLNSTIPYHATPCPNQGGLRSVLRFFSKSAQ